VLYQKISNIKKKYSSDSSVFNEIKKIWDSSYWLD